jgi:hypothetical protein
MDGTPVANDMWGKSDVYGPEPNKFNIASTENACVSLWSTVAALYADPCSWPFDCLCEMPAHVADCFADIVLPTRTRPTVQQQNMTLKCLNNSDLCYIFLQNGTVFKSRFTFTEQSLEKRRPGLNSNGSKWTTYDFLTPIFEQ